MERKSVFAGAVVLLVLLQATAVFAWIGWVLWGCAAVGTAIAVSCTQCNGTSCPALASSDLSVCESLCDQLDEKGGAYKFDYTTCIANCYAR